MPGRGASGAASRSRRTIGSLALGAALMVVASARGQTARTFFLAVDSVPYSTLEALRADGSAPELFAELGAPAPLISTFPSTTTVAMGAALAPLGVAISPGYEARFFDWAERAVRGGGPISYFKIDFPWRDFFHWTKKGVARSALASLRPVAASEKRASRALEAFLASERADFFAYVETSDTAAHLRGPKSLGTMFQRLGEAIRGARRAGEEFRVVLFSDHGIAGGEPLANVLPRVLDGLEQAGFARVDQLAGGREVVLTPYGLVSSFEAYCLEENSVELAEVLASVTGVELCAYRQAGQVWVTGTRGSALIARRGDLWAYRPRVGDPLGYRRVAEALAAGSSGRVSTGWFTDREWFEATSKERFPDALSRIAGGFELVDNPASVICSLEAGKMYGPKRTERAARLAGGRLRWTHGALSWEASVGFLMTDVPGVSSPGGVRLADLLAAKVETVRSP